MLPSKDFLTGQLLGILGIIISVWSITRLFLPVFKGIWVKMVAKNIQLIIGVDPGLTGAVGFLPRHGPLSVEDMPVKNNKVDLETLDKLIDFHFRRRWSDEFKKAVVIIEDLFSLPTNASQSMLRYGVETGRVLGMLEAIGFPIMYVVPSVWKSALGLTQNKSDSIALARKLFPSLTDRLTLKKHHGRAEALLIAHFGMRFIPEAGKSLFNGTSSLST